MKVNLVAVALWLVTVYLSVLPARANHLNVYTELLPPYQTLQQGQVSGLATHRVKKLIDHAKLEASFHIVPWARAFNTATSSPNTLIYSMNRTAKREHLFHWITVVAEFKNSFVSLKSKNVTINNITDAKNYVTAVIRDGYANTFLLEQGFVEQENLYIVPTIEEQLSLLVNGKIDFLFMDIRTVRYYMTTKGLQPNLVQESLINEQWHRNLYLAASKNTDIALINKLRNAITPRKLPKTKEPIKI